MKEQSGINDYDSEPVVYCAKCYSLSIKHEDSIGMDCCMECGCSDILTTDIADWEEKYKNRYGRKYVEKNNDLTKDPLFQLPLRKIKVLLYDCTDWKRIIWELYPEFPKGMTKLDSVLLLFDRLLRDNRIDELKILLVKHYRNQQNQ